MVRLSGTLPRPLDSFIGRKEELQAVRTLLARHRFVTLTGAAGIGKTRLALRIAEESAPGPGPQNAPSAPPAYMDGVCFVPLAVPDRRPRIAEWEQTTARSAARTCWIC